MLFLKFFVLSSAWLSLISALRIGNDHNVLLSSYKRAPLQDLVLGLSLDQVEHF